MNDTVVPPAPRDASAANFSPDANASREPGEAAAPAGERPEGGGAEELDATAPEGAEADDGFAMSEADAKLAEANGRFVKLTADFENYRKRAQREKSDLAAAVGEELIREFLPVVDNLERALAAGSGPAGAADSVVKGVELTLRQFQAVLSRNGVERFEALNRPFDPHRHEALAQEERDGLTEETVLEVLEPGYIMGNRVVRPAKVKVGRPKSS